MHEHWAHTHTRTPVPFRQTVGQTPRGRKRGKKDEKEWNNQMIFIYFQWGSAASVWHTKWQWHFTDRLTDGAGSVVKVEGKRMKERIFLLVLGQLKTSAAFSYTWSSECTTYRKSQCSCILNAPTNVRMWPFKVSASEPACLQARHYLRTLV